MCGRYSLTRRQAEIIERFGVEELIGLYHFKQASPPLLTPFGNPNHLAGFLILAGTLSAGMLLECREPLKRIGCRDTSDARKDEGQPASPSDQPAH